MEIPLLWNPHLMKQTILEPTPHSSPSQDQETPCFFPIITTFPSCTDTAMENPGKETWLSWQFKYTVPCWGWWIYVCSSEFVSATFQMWSCQDLCDRGKDMYGNFLKGILTLGSCIAKYSVLDLVTSSGEMATSSCLTLSSFRSNRRTYSCIKMY